MYCRYKPVTYNKLKTTIAYRYERTDANVMVLNADKTECMLLGTRQKLRCANANFFVRGNNYDVTPVKKHRLLGLHVYSNLSRNVHVTKLCSKLRNRLYLFNQVKRIPPLHARNMPQLDIH